MAEYKCGYVGIVGRANAGKSTLINTLVGEKVAIISPKPQTTRNNILGVLTKENYQLVFVDTPGIHKSKNSLDKYMMKNVRSCIGGSDVLLYLLDGTKSLSDEEFDYILKLTKTNENVIILITKIDLVKKDKVFEKIAVLTEIKEIKDIIPISSIKDINIKPLIDAVLKILPSSETKSFLYAEDEYTDKSISFMVAEMVRESALKLYGDEIPHGIAPKVVRFEEKDEIVYIDIDIVCERDTHKSIILGKQGLKIKELGKMSRIDMEKLLSKKVMLKLFVKVEKDWRNNMNSLTEFGYNNKFD